MLRNLDYRGRKTTISHFIIESFWHCNDIKFMFYGMILSTYDDHMNRKVELVSFMQQFEFIIPNLNSEKTRAKTCTSMKNSFRE